jgi:periplasmic protein CpxP/Spy
MSYLRNHKLLLLIIGVLLVANIGLLYFFVFNKPQRSAKITPGEMRRMQVEKVKKDVGLNEEQTALYDSLRSKQFKTMKPLFENITKSKEEFFSLIYQSNISDSVLSSYASKIGEKQMELDMSTFRYFQSIKALCTEEQKSKMDSVIKQIVKRIINNSSSGPRRPSPDKKEGR